MNQADSPRSRPAVSVITEDLVDNAIRRTNLARPRLAAPVSQWLLFGANAVALVAVLVLLFTIQPKASTLRVGGIAGETIVAQRRVTYIDHGATAARRQQARAAATAVYRLDTSQARLRQQQAALFLSDAGRILANKESAEQRSETIRALLPSGVSPASLQQFPNLTATDLKVVQSRAPALLEQTESLRFDLNQVPTTEYGLLSTLPSHITLSQRTAIGEVLSAFLRPTLVPDLGATKARQDQAAARISPAVNTVASGELVVRRGDLITPAVMEKLTALGLQSPHRTWRDLMSSLLFAAIIVVMLFWYLHSFHGNIVTTPRLLLLIDASIIATVGAARVLTAGHVLLPFFLPVAGIATFAAVLVGAEASIAIAFAMAVLAGWVVANSFELTVYYFLSSAAGVLAVRQVRRLKQFVLAGAYISLFALATALAFGLVDRSYDFPALREYVGAAAFNGLASSTLALGGFALLSGFFGVTTMLHLFELGQPNQPLMRQLMVKAPGTYNHSLIVASMVERAAEEIGANSLVGKVAALYHDIGKSANPHCFVENQMGIGNIHDELRAPESARIIRSHVAQGLRLARQHKLPRVVLDAIGQHHGTMTISYFLHKAQTQAEGGDFDVSLYAYPGPKPQAKETALLMLADGCESAVRAAADHSAEKIREIVETMFEDRIKQGQLDESHLTLRDLNQARDAFCAVLTGLYHPRIDYPETVDRPVDLPLSLSGSPTKDTPGGA